MGIGPSAQQLTDAAAIVDSWIRYRALMGGVPGVSFGLSHDGEVMLSKGWGYADLETRRPAAPDTAYRVASITKTVTATLVMQLVERGRVRLDDPVTSYLRWLEPSLGSSGVTVRHLLTHSGGLIRDGSGTWSDEHLPDRDSLHRDLGERATVAEPSAGFGYSNVAYALLGEIIEKVSGRSFASAVANGVGKAIGWTGTGTSPSSRLGPELATGYLRRRPGEAYQVAAPIEPRAFEPAGGLISNIEDLLEYQQAHLPGDSRLLSELSKREMQRVQWQRREEPHHGYGWMIWSIDGIAVRGHSGGYPGFVTKIGFAPELRVAAAVLTNSVGRLAELGIDAVFHTIARVTAVWDEAGASARGHSRSALGRFAGQYRSGFGELLIARVNRSLYLIDPDDDRPMRVAARLAPGSDSARFVVCDNEDYGLRGEELSFDIGARGRASQIHYGSRVLPRVELRPSC